MCSGDGSVLAFRLVDNVKTDLPWRDDDNAYGAGPLGCMGFRRMRQGEDSFCHERKSHQRSNGKSHERSA